MKLVFNLSPQEKVTHSEVQGSDRPSASQHGRPLMLRRVWDKFSYRLNFVRAAGGGHIEHS